MRPKLIKTRFSLILFGLISLFRPVLFLIEKQRFILHIAPAQAFRIILIFRFLTSICAWDLNICFSAGILNLYRGPYPQYYHFYVYILQFKASVAKAVCSYAWSSCRHPRKSELLFKIIRHFSKYLYPPLRGILLIFSFFVQHFN
jgi:hypothetical protein